MLMLSTLEYVILSLCCYEIIEERRKVFYV